MKINMKSLLTAMALMAAVTIYAQPQGGRGADMTPEQRAEMMAKRMKSELNLTDEQTEAVKQLNLTNMPKQGERPDEETRKQMREQRQTELQKILTPEQFAKWQESQKNMMQRGQGMQSRGGGAPAKEGENAEKRMNRMKEELSLTDEQVAQLKEMQKSFSTENKQKMMDLNKEQSAAYEEQLQKVLTPEQFAKLQELRKEHQKKNPQVTSKEKK